MQHTPAERAATPCDPAAPVPRCNLVCSTLQPYHAIQAGRADLAIFLGTSLKVRLALALALALALDLALALAP